MTQQPYHEAGWPPLPEPLAGPPQKKPNRTALVLVLVGLAIVVGAGAIVAIGVALDSRARQELFTPTPTALETADAECVKDASGVAIGDSGRTLTIDRAGAELSEQTSIDEVACILTALDVPDAVMAKIESTRALDGRQEATWGDGRFHASWTYHPDDGLNMIIEEK